ncbi:hypothetical protein HY491_00320 [Candidatus Woesearchaeota archaeon]|nr:hypothetical protein [Candidatus Woesearchaeota archaeon]
MERYHLAKQAVRAYCEWKGIEALFDEQNQLRRGTDPIMYIGILHGILGKHDLDLSIPDQTMASRYRVGYNEGATFRSHLLQRPYRFAELYASMFGIVANPYFFTST